jgi:DNA-binding NarL/FixJ family response regulator
VDRAILAGAKGFVSKSSKPTILLNAACELLKGKQFLDPNLLCTSTIPEFSTTDMREVIPPRTKQVLEFMAKGHSNKSIANYLSITEATVKWHVSRLFDILKVNNRTTCVTKAISYGLI